MDSAADNAPPNVLNSRGPRQSSVGINGGGEARPAGREARDGGVRILSGPGPGP
jgi:hypothetical protein